MAEPTEEDIRAVNANRGLPESVLLELTELDAFAIQRGCRFSEQRKAASAARLRCIQLRREHGLGRFDKLRREG